MLRSTTMTTIGVFLLLCGALFPAFAAQALAAEVEEGFTPIFNGKDLTGWDGKFANWYVADGAITGENSPQRPCTKCNYLFWRGGKPADFELRCLYRVSSQGNSGVQFRSRELPDFDVAGYQADISGDSEYTGTLYDCNGRRTIAWRGQKVVIAENGKREITSFGDPAALQKLVKANDWNDYRIVARGPEITLTINGAVMSRTIDREKGKATRDGLDCAATSRRPVDESAVQEYPHPEFPLDRLSPNSKRFLQAPTKRQSNEEQTHQPATFSRLRIRRGGRTLAALPDSFARAGRPGRPGANEIVNVAVIGCGSRASQVAHTSFHVPQMRIAAVCDCDRPRPRISPGPSARKTGRSTRISAR